MTIPLRPRLSWAAALVAGLTACTTPHPTATAAPKGNDAMKSTPRKQQVAALLHSIETGEPGPVASINPARYIQHNLAVGDGLAGFGEVLRALPPGSARARVVRAFQDGDFVFAHTDYDFFGAKVGFDVFRFEDGRIVEHWDNLQQKPEKPNPSGRTMIDGPTEPADLAKTQANKALVRSFLEDVLVGGQADKLPTYLDGERYRQHNPGIADGLSGLGAALEQMAKAGLTMRYSKVHKVLGEGSFVLAMSEGTFAGAPTSFYDLFRVEGGRVVEHWDTLEAIPPPEQWKNANGKF
ncbi:MAG: nuclear transport factor 2 family protein [Myxococcales bacterium]